MAPTAFAYFVLLYAVFLTHCACKATDVELNNFGTTSVVPTDQLATGQAGLAGENNSRKIVKRAPSGFMGMRGKKLYENEWTNDGPNPMEQDDGDGSLVDNIRYKKAPNAFIGMRGKKYTPHDLNRLGQLIQRLEEDRLRENILQDFIGRLTMNNVDKSNEVIAKRAPTGFTGMRGKRLADYEETQDFLFDEDNVGHDEAKRVPVNAFLGVRGKKDASHQHYKRAAPQAFDTRGKKQRFVDFSNKFVAVRGKKNTDINGNMLSESLVDNDADDDDTAVDAAAEQQLADMRYWLRYPELDDEAAATIWHKRAPSGFTGMRGKRSAQNPSSLQ